MSTVGFEEQASGIYILVLSPLTGGLLLTESTKSPKHFLFEVGKMEGQDLKQWVNKAAEAKIVMAMLTGCI